MGLFATIFRNNSGNSSKNRQKNKNNRICRIEEMESRDLLSASPYNPPDPIDFGVVYHEDYVQTQTNQVEDTRGDTFTVSWNGGAENTKLTELTIDLSTAAGNLYFNINPNAPQGANGGAWNFHVSADSDIQNCAFTLSADGKSVTISFGEDFTADKVLKFTVDVNMVHSNGAIAPIVEGATFGGTTTSAVFESENYESTTIDTSFANDFNTPENLQVPGDDYGEPGESRQASTAGAIVTGHDQTPLTGKISGFVYDDANNNGIKENGDKGIGNVSLSLWAWDDETQQYVDTGKTATTNTDGYYEFTNVEAFQQYQIRETQPDDYKDGKESVGSLGGVKPTVDNDTIGKINMPANGIGENYNFAEYKEGSISGHVVDDVRTPIPGTTVELYDDEGNKIGETVTDEDGYYEFTDLPPGEYVVREIHPEGYCEGGREIGNLGGELSTDNEHQIENVIIRSGDDGVEYNFIANRRGELGGYVYVDSNANGVKDDGERGIKGAELSLWVWDEDTQAYINTGKTAITDANGHYLFAGLCPFETYQIREAQPENYDDGKDSLGTIDGDPIGVLPDVDNDTIGKIALPPNGHGDNYNFGELPIAGSLGGYVYIDANKNGVKDDGEAGIGGVVISLYEWNGEKYVNTGKTATTAADGSYEFTGLTADKTYQLQESQPEDYNDAKESLGTINGVQVGTLPDTDDDTIGEIAMPTNGVGENYNFGEVEKPVIPPPTPEPSAISGYVYLDANKDGLRSTDERGISNTMILLEKFDGEKYVIVAQTYTDANGHYVFSDLEPDATYRVVEVQPNGYEQGENSVGSLGGTVENDTIGDILLPEETVGTEYNFGERLPNVPPPTDKPNIPNTPPSVPLPGPGGALGQPGLAAAPAWQTPNLTESMRTGFGTGAVMASSQAYSWHLSVLNAGYPRSNGSTDGIAAEQYASKTTMILSDTEESSSDGARYVSVSWSPLPMNQSGWYVRGKDGVVRKQFSFGPDGGTPVVGDFSGDGIANVAVYHEGNWYVDVNGNGKWDEEDLWAQMGGAADQPVSGDWDGDGKTDIGVFGPQWSGDQQILKAESGLPSDLNTTVSAVPKNVPPDIAINVSMNNVRAMKHSQSGGVRLDVVDHVFQYGNEGDKAFTGDFTGDGIATIGVYRDGKWYIDRTGSGKWDENAVFVDNAEQGLGAEGVPVIGDFDGDGIDNIGIYVNGTWHLDTTGDFKFDTQVEFGEAGDYPVVGDFDGSGIAQLAVYRASAEESLYASNAPEAAPAIGEGLVARQFTGDDQGSAPNQESLQHHGRSMTTPHTNAPLLRGK